MKWLVFYILICCSITANSQKKKEIKKYGIKTVVSTETRGGKTINDSKTTFNSAGLATEEIKYDTDGNLKSITKYNYTTSGEVLEEMEYNAKNDLTEKRIYKYNALDEKIEELTLNANGKQLKKIIYTYDKRGLRTAKFTYDAGNNLVVTKRTTYSGK
jgi:hypothetical protein